MRGIFLSHKESKRVYIMERVVQGLIKGPEAAQLLGISERQVRRLKGAMEKEGLAGLAHKNRGKKPKNAIGKLVREEVVKHAQEKYRGASYAHMAELLAEREKVSVSPKTVGRILKGAGMKHEHTHKRPRRHKSRDRRSQEGALIQIDASAFDWFEERGPRLTLHGAIDDATSKIVGLHFRPNEDGLGYFRVLDQVVKSVGVPLSAYSDRHTIFISPISEKLSFEDEVAGRKVPLTQFGRALAQLGIRHIPARTPQAKGRIERLWGTLQERLVIELRLAGITRMEEANDFLPEFIRRHNRRFAVVAALPEKASAPRPGPAQLERIICWHDERRASHGSSISFHGEKYQLIDSKGDVALLAARSKVLILTDLAGSQRALCGEVIYGLKLLPKEQLAEQVQPVEKRMTERAATSPPKPAARQQIAFGKRLRSQGPVPNLLVRTM